MRVARVRRGKKSWVQAQRATVSFCFFIVYLGLSNAQLLCSPIAVADIGSTTELSTDGLKLLARSLVVGGEGGPDPIGPVRVLGYKVLCDASGSMRA